MEEKGYYTPYKGQMLLYETQLWISDKMLAKIIYDILERNFVTMPNVHDVKSREFSSFPAPFDQNKRFPKTGKYARVGFDTVWFQLFKNVYTYNDRICGDEINIEVVNNMMVKFENEIDMFDRESFENIMKIQWKNDPNDQCNVIEEGHYTPYEGRMFLHEKQIWISEKMLAKIINDILEGEYDTIPNFGMGSSTTLLFYSPFEQKKRFPLTSKYAKVSPGSVWFEIFTNVKKGKKDPDMVTKFENEVDLLNRESFESTMKIRWQYNQYKEKNYNKSQTYSNKLYQVNDVD